jgi:ubiquinone biosynthesis protein UbiJ
MIHEDIRNLLDAPPTGDEAPTLDHIEHTLTSGYARALALEAERRRLERKIADLAARLAQEITDEDATQLAKLSQGLADADADLTRLRALLASLRTRADEVRAA